MEYRPRILLIVTEQSPLQRLWEAVEEHRSNTGEEIVALYVKDERWRRAASLSFTREVSRVSGSHRKFTPQRAAQLDQDTVSQVRSRLGALAIRAELQPVFEVLAEHEVSRIRNYVRVEEDLLVISADVRSQPMYQELTQLSCRTVCVDAEERKHE